MNNKPIFSCMFHISRTSPSNSIACWWSVEFRFEAPIDASDKVHAVKLENDIIVVLETLLPDE